MSRKTIGSRYEKDGLYLLDSSSVFATPAIKRASFTSSPNELLDIAAWDIYFFLY